MIFDLVEGLNYDNKFKNDLYFICCRSVMELKKLQGEHFFTGEDFYLQKTF